MHTGCLTLSADVLSPRLEGTAADWAAPGPSTPEAGRSGIPRAPRRSRRRGRRGGRAGPCVSTHRLAAMFTLVLRAALVLVPALIAVADLFGEDGKKK